VFRSDGQTQHRIYFRATGSQSAHLNGSFNMSRAARFSSASKSCEVYDHADAPHTLTLLRARRQRPSYGPLPPTNTLIVVPLVWTVWRARAGNRLLNKLRYGKILRKRCLAEIGSSRSRSAALRHGHSYAKLRN
jgi:hypothetical protein